MLALHYLAHELQICLVNSVCSACKTCANYRPMHFRIIQLQISYCDYVQKIMKVGCQ